MENFRGICTKCGIAHSNVNHVCTDDDARLVEIDRAKVRLLTDVAMGNGDISTVIQGQPKTPKQRLQELESEASTIRQRKVK